MKKRILLFLMVLVALVTTACEPNSGTGTQVGATSNSIFSRPVVEREPGKRKAWNDVSSFVCYYGDFDFEFQSKFDVIIMHSNTLYNDPQSKEKVKA